MGLGCRVKASAVCQALNRAHMEQPKPKWPSFSSLRRPNLSHGNTAFHFGPFFAHQHLLQRFCRQPFACWRAREWLHIRKGGAMWPPTFPISGSLNPTAADKLVSEV